MGELVDDGGPGVLVELLAPDHELLDLGVVEADDAAAFTRPWVASGDVALDEAPRKQ